MADVFIRFIYAYFLGDKPVYVGSSWDPAQRDKTHSKGGDNLPFQRFMAKHGRANFTHRIMEAFRTDDIGTAWRISAARENHWMDVLGTWHEHGGYNYGRAAVNFDSAQQYKAWLAANVAAARATGRNRSPEWRTAMAAAMRKGWQTPEWRAGHADAMRKLANNTAWRTRLAARMASTEYRAKVSAIVSTPEFKAKQSAALCAAWARPESKARLSAAIRARLASPEARARLGAVVRAAAMRPEVKAKQSAAQKARYAADPSERARISAAVRANYVNDPSQRMRTSEATRKAMARPDVKARMAAMRHVHQTPDVKAKISAASRSYYANPEARERQRKDAVIAHAKLRRARQLLMLPFPLAVLERYADLGPVQPRINP